MRVPRTPSFVAATLLALPLTTFAPGTSYAAGETCDGQAATIVVSSAPNPDVIGTDGDDVVVITTTDQVNFDALAGDDVVCAGAGTTEVLGGPGDDTLEGGPGTDRLNGGRGRDTISGGSGGDDRLEGQQGDDILEGSHDNANDAPAGTDFITGDVGNDRIVAYSGSVHGGPGEDDLTIRGPVQGSLSSGADHILVDYAGQDRTGTTEISGGVGPDVIDVVKSFGSPATTINGYHGDDLLRYTPLQTQRRYTLDQHEGTIKSRGRMWLTFVQVDAFDAGSERDVMVGDARSDVFSGGGGNDVMHGLGGDDDLLGGTGHDTAYGGVGHDRCRAEVRDGCEAR